MGAWPASFRPEASSSRKAGSQSSSQSEGIRSVTLNETNSLDVEASREFVHHPGNSHGLWLRAKAELPLGRPPGTVKERYAHLE